MDPRTTPARLKAPHLPKALPLAVLPRDMPTDGETYSRLEYQQLDLTERSIARLHLEEVVCTRLIASGTRFDHLRLEDVRFTGGTLTNAAWPNLSCVRAEFTTCRMTGFSAMEALFQDTVFRECKADFAQFYKATMRGVRFEACPLTETDFRSTDLTGAVFARCDLTNTDFRGATLQGADLRGCPIDGMRVGPGELRGAIVDEAQALALVRAMGIVVDASGA